MHIFRVPLDKLSIAPDCPTGHKTFVLEHLKHCYAKNNQAPTVDVNRNFQVTRNSINMQIARDLGCSTVSAVVSNSDFELMTPEVRDSIRELQSDVVEDECAPIDRWDIIYFETLPDDDAINKIVDSFDIFLRKTSKERMAPENSSYSEIGFDTDGPCLEIKYVSPPVDHYVWISWLYGLLLKIHRTIARIASYQGTRFEDPLDGP